jgi:hypothetical protein
LEGISPLSRWRRLLPIGEKGWQNNPCAKQSVEVKSTSPMMSLRNLLNASAFFAALYASTRFRAESDRVDFQRQIRPILSANCFHCHGPDEQHRKAKLRLDDEAAAKEKVIVPGQPEQSEVMVRLRSTNPEEQMPPEDLMRRNSLVQQMSPSSKPPPGLRWRASSSISTNP